VAKLYYYLDRGFTPLNVFVEYLPLPRFIQRDAAHQELTALFMSIIKTRKETSEEKYDVLNTLINSTYKDGEKMSDKAVAHMMIALLLAGQHTSSTTSTWCLFRLAENPELM
jgi:sterol 14alpha-demethylase